MKTNKELMEWCLLRKKGTYDFTGNYLGHMIPEDAVRALFTGMMLVPEVVEQQVKTVYAVADVVPEMRQGYLTEGKEYEVEAHPLRMLFFITDNCDNLVLCRWEECQHLNGGNWRRVER